MGERVDNSKGKIFYGMHFYPGVARYEEPNTEPLTVFINEDTIRKMGPTFAGRPIFVEHIEDVEPDINELRKEADGWVVESFFNQADGKHWAKFIIVSDRGFLAIQKGFRLSNAYLAQSYGNGGQWNGIDYQKEVTGGEFDHLAIVKHPRYEESIIMTPEEFKAHNNACVEGLQKFANSKGEKKMGLNIFKRTKVENSKDVSFDGLIIELPKSKKEILLTTLVEEYDKIMNMHGYASDDHMVKVGENEMSVKKLVKEHMNMASEYEKLKSAKSETDGEPGEDDGETTENDSEREIEASESADVGDRGGDKHLDNEDDEVDEDEDKKDKKKNAKFTLDEARKMLAKEKAAKLKNANVRVVNSDEPEVRIALPQDQVSRGKQLYGSGR